MNTPSPASAPAPRSFAAMNWPNRLTVGRLFLTVLFVAFLHVEWRFQLTAALLLFIIASITDIVDGEIARRYGMITNFGKLMDPLVDKVLITAAFICLVPLNAIPAWVAILIVAREFLVTGLRLLATSQGVILSAEKLGKHKTLWQIVTIIFFLVMLAMREFEPVAGAYLESDWWQAGWIYGGWALIALAAGFTVWSGLGYAWKNRDLLRTE